MASYNSPRFLRERITRNLAPFATGLVFGLGLVIAGCNGFGDDSPRAAWERYMNSFAARDYGSLWDSMSDDSHKDTIRVLTHVKRDPRYRESMQKKFSIPPQALATMQPRDFFIALMNGADRALPQVVETRAEKFKTATFSHEVIRDDRAKVFWQSGSGPPESTEFRLEEGRWKPVIKR